jgi:phage/plasmid-like protein (TIGR03299 family)
MNSLISLDSRAGSDIAKLTDFDQVLSKSGLNFEIESVRPHTPEGDEVNNKWMIRRTDNHDVLGIVGNRYNTVSNKSMLKPFHSMVCKYGAKYENAGMVDGGARCWVSATMPEGFAVDNRPEDVIQQRIMAFFTHNGTSKNAYFSIAHRVFCNNQLNVVSREASKSDYSIRHVRNWEDQLLDAHLGFENALALHKEFEYTANQLNSVPMNVKEMRGFANLVIAENKYASKSKPGEKQPPIDKDKQERKLQRLNNRREMLVDLFTQGAGNKGESRWDALNAVTEFVDHHNQISRVNHPTRGQVHAEKRMFGNLFSGNGVRTKQRAVDLLLSTSTFKSVAPCAV